MNNVLFFVVFVLGVVCGSVFVLTAHNCCCDHHAPHCESCKPCVCQPLGPKIGSAAPE